jgi:hypothetical protein
MSKGITYLKAFTTQIDRFLNDLVVIFPQERQIKMYKNSIEIIKNVNPRKIMDGFTYYIFPYKTQIENRDEKFFMEQNYDDIIDENSIDENSKQDNLVEALALKKIWKNLDKEKKDIIWKYFEVLIKIIERDAAMSK